MPRLPRNVPMSKTSGDGGIYASLVFACVYCWSSNHWAFIAYNDEGRVYQVRRCRYWSCIANDGKGKWITQDECFERTKYQYEGECD